MSVVRWILLDRLLLNLILFALPIWQGVVGHWLVHSLAVLNLVPPRLPCGPRLLVVLVGIVGLVKRPDVLIGFSLIFSSWIGWLTHTLDPLIDKVLVDLFKGRLLRGFIDVRYRVFGWPLTFIIDVQFVWIRLTLIVAQEWPAYVFKHRHIYNLLNLKCITECRFIDKFYNFCILIIIK